MDDAGAVDLSCVDLDRLAELRQLQNGLLLDQAINRFANPAESVEVIDALVGEGDLGAAQAMAHKLAGRCLTMGATDAASQARIVEQHLAEGAADRARAALPELRHEYERAAQALIRYRELFG